VRRLNKRKENLGDLRNLRPGSHSTPRSLEVKVDSHSRLELDC